MFVAPRWLRDGHLQTIWANVLRRSPLIAARRERLELPDGDFVDLDWVGDGNPIVIVLHGLQGSSRSPYAAGILRALAQRGNRAVLMNFRGCSGEPNRLARSYHSGDTGDIAFLVQTLRAREPHTPLAAVGYSLGGNVLLKWLGEQGQAAPLQAAVAVSVPFLLADAVTRLGQGLSRVYEQYLLRRLKAGVLVKQHRMDLPLKVNVADLDSLWAFDEHVTAPLHGFTGADDYYTRSSSRQYLAGITVPTLILHAADDPFMSVAAIPRADELSVVTRLELSTQGGHVGFVYGAPWAPRYWLEERIPAYFAQAVGWVPPAI